MPRKILLTICEETLEVATLLIRFVALRVLCDFAVKFPPSENAPFEYLLVFQQAPPAPQSSGSLHFDPASDISRSITSR